MAKYDVVIIDDEPYDIRIAEKAFREIHQVGEIRSFTKAIEGFNAVLESPPDVLLLDVEMPQMSGLDLYQTLPADKRPPVILYTKSEQYAYQGIKLAVADYLIKPVSFPDLYRAFKHALEQKDIHIKVDINMEPTGKWFSFKDMDRLVRFNDIVAVSSQRNYAIFHLRNPAEDFSYRLTMDEAEAMLPKSTFVRVHRGFMVNIDFVTGMVERKLTLPDRTDLVINVSDAGWKRLNE